MVTEVNGGSSQEASRSCVGILAFTLGGEASGRFWVQEGQGALDQLAETSFNVWCFSCLPILPRTQ